MATKKKPPSPRCLALMALRHERGWTQEQLADATQISSKMISQYESGERNPPLAKLLQFAAALGFGSAEVDCALFGMEAICGAEEPEGSWLSTEQRRSIRQRSAQAGLEQARSVHSALLREAQEERWQEERQLAEPHARSLIQVAADAGAKTDSDARIRKIPPGIAWAVVERLAEESLRAIVVEPLRALRIAEIGCEVADSSGSTAHKAAPRLQAQALAFRANALRVLGDLAEADEAFKLVGQLLKRKGPSGGGPVFPIWRFLSLQGSLRRDQRRFSEALRLFNRALEVAPTSEQAHILLNKAFALQTVGEDEQAIEALLLAEPLVDREKNQRLPLVLRFNLVVSLVAVGRTSEAEELLPEARKLAEKLQNDVDLVRCLWLSGRIAAALGRDQEALAALTKARRQYTDLKLPCDAAGVALEEAVLRLRRGGMREVKALAEEIYWIFGVRGVGPDAVAALRVFCEATMREEVTIEHAQTALRALAIND